VGAAVIAVPACFDAAQRRGVLAAAGLAGVPVLRLISEPTAVALAYGLHTRYAQTVLVVDVGGGSLDVAVVRTGYGLVEVVAAGGDDRLGGEDFDTVLAEHLAGRGRREHGEDPLADAEMSQRLRAVARRAKVALSYLDTTEVVLPGGGRLGLTRPELEQVTAGLRRRLDPPIRQVLAAAGLTPTDLDQTIVVGAGSRMPAIRAQLHHLTRPGPPPVSIHPEETTACGAAIQAAALAGPPDADAVRALSALAVAPQAIREPVPAGPYGEPGGFVATAARERAEDGAVRDLIGARHALGDAAGRVDRLLAELGDRVPNGEVHRARLLMREASDAVHALALERVRALTGALRTTMASLTSQAGRGVSRPPP
jgi:hypothetical protein